MLRDKLYTVEGSSVTEGGAAFDLRLNPDDGIYRVHFPGSPITPGACLIQIAKELASELRGREMGIEVIRNVKFIAPVIPTATPEVTYTAEIAPSEEGREHWKVNIHNGGAVFAKLSLIFS